MKAFMYEADNLDDFKKKLKSYEIQFLALKDEKPRQFRSDDKEERKASCYNCGDKSHLSPDCPSKDKGPKCFKCNAFGHKSSSCFSKRKGMKEKNILTS